jgi:hypothetical protein
VAFANREACQAGDGLRGVTANILLPGGATATGMIPDEMPDELSAHLLDPTIMGPPIVWLASADAACVHDERIVARDFQN